MKNIRIGNGEISINGEPDECPFCHNSITPNILHGRIKAKDNSLEVFFSCPNQECALGFLGYYYFYENAYYYQFSGQTTQGNIEYKEFSETITKISNSFITIYNQAYAAEQQNLMEICGVGYRKALEFLIKDYTILHKPSDQEAIEKMLLGNCITKYVNDVNIKKVAKRAVWLGNDETHYVRIWEGKNLNDLKMLIDLTLHWIEMESLTNSIEIDMPD
jgi:hypothetical protein